MNDVIERAKRWAQQDIDEETSGELLALLEQQNVSDL